MDVTSSVITSETSTTGNYTVERNINKLGDCYVNLNYSDGRVLKCQRIYYEDNIDTLSFVNGKNYEFDLRK